MSLKYKLTFSLIMIASILRSPLIAQAKDPLGKKWTRSKQISINEINHDAFNSILKKYVDTNGYVNYTSLKNNSEDHQSLKSYLSHLSRANSKLKSTKNAKLAFWINAYNAVTLEGILQVYPTTSIRNHTAKFFGYNIWKELPLTVGNEQFSLEAIEHQILRKMSEPRIHFAIVCASIGCPRLLNEAYSAKNVDQQLTANAIDFFSRKNHYRIDHKNKTIYLSSILDWFGSDFGNSDSSMLKYLIPFFPDKSKPENNISKYRIKYLSYNWDLNDQMSLQK